MTDKKKSYYEKLRDPRWQKRRLEIMHGADFECMNCGAKDQMLNVHHLVYIKNRDPWDYENSELICLCEACHKQVHDKINELVLLLSADPLTIEACIGFALGHLDIPPSSVDIHTMNGIWFCHGYAAGKAKFTQKEAIDITKASVRKST